MDNNAEQEANGDQAVSIVNHPDGVDVARIRTAEIAWLDNHPALAAALAGQWIALDGDSLVSSGPDFDAVLRQALANGHAHPFITRVPGGSVAFVLEN